MICSASRTAAQSTDQQSRACSPAHLKFRLLAFLWRMGFGFKFGGATSANQIDTVYDGCTVWHQSQIQRRRRTYYLAPVTNTATASDVLSSTSHKYSDGVGRTIGHQSQIQRRRRTYYLAPVTNTATA